MKKIWEKYKEFFILLVYIILFACIIMFVARPLFDKIREKRDYAEKKSIDMDITQEKIKELPQIKDKMELIGQKEKNLEIFFRQEDAISLIEHLEGLATETGNNITINIVEENNKIDKKDIKKNSKDKEVTIKGDLIDYNYLTMRIVLNGDFNSIHKFIKRTESMAYFSDIISLKLSQKNDTIDDQRKTINSSIFKGSSAPVEEDVVEESRRYESPIDATLDVIFYTE
jgi:hypothetical protein